jgi:hypothetical protein
MILRFRPQAERDLQSYPGWRHFRSRSQLSSHARLGDLLLADLHSRAGIPSSEVDANT